MWMRFCPGERLLFGLKKPINDNGVAFSRMPPGQAGGFASDHGLSGVHGRTCRIRKDNFAAVRNFLWIDSAMRFA
jgi:hypothetical protein